MNALSNPVMKTAQADTAAVISAAPWATTDEVRTRQQAIEPDTIADYVDAAAVPYVSADLISPHVLSNVRPIGCTLPGALTDFFGFECPLGTREPKAD